MSDLKREESFRTALKNQKRRLSATKLPCKPIKEPTTIVAPNLKVVNKRQMSREDSLPETDDDSEPEPEPESEVTEDFRSEENGTGSGRESPAAQAQRDFRLDSPAARPASPYTPATPSPLVKSPHLSAGRHAPSSRPDSPAMASNGLLKKERSPVPPDSPLLNRIKKERSPVPPDSPLLCRRNSPAAAAAETPPASPTVRMARQFNKELRRARSFREGRSRSRTRKMSTDSDKNESIVPAAKKPEPAPTPAATAAPADTKKPQQQPFEPVEPASGDDEQSFSVRKHAGGRQGWKIMPESGTQLKTDALKKVVGMIKQMELSGHVIPERITVKV